MKWTKKKPTKEGWYWYGKTLFYANTGDVAPGVILIIKACDVVDTDNTELAAVHPFREDIVALESIGGWFSDEPIAMPEGEIIKD